MSKTENSMKSVKLTQKLTESSIMLALAVILSILKVAELPYGGSITLASMLPMIIISYRYGFGWGSLTGFVYALIQMLFGLKNLSYATSVVAAIAIILLDYIFAFMATCLGALFRNMKKAPVAFGCAAFTVCLVRYIFHVISGCTVWAGLSIPTTDAFFYSLIYNATYMLPETIVTILAAVYISSLLDFSSPRLSAVKTERLPLYAHILNAVSGFLFVAALATAVVMIFPHLQNAETGEFDITGIATVNSSVILIIAIVALALICILQIAKFIALSRSKK